MRDPCPAELVLVGGLPDAGKLGLAAPLAYWHADDRFPDDEADLPPVAVGRLAALLRWPTCTHSRSLDLLRWQRHHSHPPHRLVTDIDVVFADEFELAVVADPQH